MTRAAKITYLAALVLGLAIGVVAGYKGTMSLLTQLDDAKHAIPPFSLSELSQAQYAHADVEHAHAALLTYANVLGEMQKLPEKSVSAELSNTYIRLAILSDEANDSEGSTSYMLKARQAAENGGGAHTDSELKDGVEAADEVLNQTSASVQDQQLLRLDLATFGFERSTRAVDAGSLDADFIWTDSSGDTRNRARTIQFLQSSKRFRLEGGRSNARTNIAIWQYGPIGIVRENRGNLYTLRVWVKRPDGWRALVYQAVAIGAPPTFEQGSAACKNPCEAVPFQPRTADEREVIHSYQAVERAVTAHNSREWGAHIADEFFAVTSNSDRPLDKATRMAGLDNQKVAGIAPFPLVSARMFEFGDAMVMISRQQPEHGLPLHVTRIWFKRNGTWLEAYSYQTTIQPASTPH